MNTVYSALTPYGAPDHKMLSLQNQQRGQDIQAAIASQNAALKSAMHRASMMQRQSEADSLGDYRGDMLDFERQKWGDLQGLRQGEMDWAREKFGLEGKREEAKEKSALKRLKEVLGHQSAEGLAARQHKEMMAGSEQEAKIALERMRQRGASDSQLQAYQHALEVMRQKADAEQMMELQRHQRGQPDRELARFLKAKAAGVVFGPDGQPMMDPSRKSREDEMHAMKMRQLRMQEMVGLADVIRGMAGGGGISQEQIANLEQHPVFGELAGMLKPWAGGQQAATEQFMREEQMTAQLSGRAEAAVESWMSRGMPGGVEGLVGELRGQGIPDALLDNVIDAMLRPGGKLAGFERKNLMSHLGSAIQGFVPGGGAGGPIGGGIRSALEAQLAKLRGG